MTDQHSLEVPTDPTALHGPRDGGPALVVEGVTMDFGTYLALDAVDLVVAPGQFVALTGPSGSGKTTLLSVVSGALAPTSGAVRLGDEPVRDRESAARLGIGVVPQGNALVTPMTARENVIVPQLAFGTTYAVASERSVAALTAVGLGDSANHLVEELSGGQQQRVAAARGLALNCAVVLADEPTSDLDSTTRDLIVGLLLAEARAGAAVVMATHDAEAAAQADLEYHLNEGRLERVR